MRRMVISNGSDVASYLGVGTRGSVGRREGAVLDEVLASLLGSRVTRGHTLPVAGVDGMLANHEREGKTKSEDCWIFYFTCSPVQPAVRRWCGTFCVVWDMAAIYWFE